MTFKVVIKIWNFMYFPNYQNFNPVCIFIFMRSVYGICLVSLNEYVRNEESPIFGTFIKLFSRTGNFMPPNTTGKTKGLTTFCTFINCFFIVKQFLFNRKPASWTLSHLCRNVDCFYRLFHIV